MALKQSDYSGRLIRLSSLIEYPKVSLDTYCTQRGKIEHRTHAFEYLTFESFDINLDDRRGLVSCGEKGVSPDRSHQHGRGFITAREVVARSRVPAPHRQPRVAIVIGKGYRNNLPRGTSGPIAASLLQYCDTGARRFKRDHFPRGSDGGGE
jgi:hypothetical protein